MSDYFGAIQRAIHRLAEHDRASADKFSARLAAARTNPDNAGQELVALQRDVHKAQIAAGRARSAFDKSATIPQAK